MQIVNKDINELISAEYNPRQLTKDQFKQLTDSIKRFGIVDPIIINKNKDRENIVIGGHQRLKVSEELKITNIPCVELDLSLQEERELNVRLNKNTGEWDYDILANMFDMDELKEWGFAEKELLGSVIEDDSYTKKIISPIYKVKNEKPLLKDIIDEDKKNKLVKKIEESSISDDDKDFLIKSAMRHMVFNYAKIADYYAHSDHDVQELMEESALIIIDYNKAIENGFVELTENLLSLRSDDE